MADHRIARSIRVPIECLFSLGQDHAGPSFDEAIHGRVLQVRFSIQGCGQS